MMDWHVGGSVKGSEGSDIVGSRIVRVGRVGGLVGRGQSKGVKRKIGGMHSEIKEREEKSHDNSKYILRLKV